MLRIINFHGVGTPDRPLDPGEAPYWVSRDRFCAILDRIAAHPKRDAIRISFDDSNASDLAIAAPELLQRGLRACFFVLTGRFGAGGSLQRSDIETLRGMGMDVGSHGIGHCDLTTLGGAELHRELADSKAELGGAEVRSFAIPFGRYNKRVLRAIGLAGYVAAFTSDGGTAAPHAFVQARRSVRSDMSEGEVDDILGGRMPLAQRARRAAAMAAKRLL